MKPLRFAPAIGWFILSFYLLTLPGNKMPKLNFFEKIHGDKMVHIGMFAVLVFLFQLSFKAFGQYKLLNASLLIAIAALAYGVAMEFVQRYFVVGRSFELADIAADAVGSFLPYFILVIRTRPVSEAG